MQAKTNQKANFFENLQFLITKSGLKKSQIAAELGIHPVSFYRYFSEQRLPKPSVLAKISQFFGIDANTLLTQKLATQPAPPEQPTNPTIPPSLPALDQITADTDFTNYFKKRTQELQDYINDYVNDILKKYNQIKNI